MKEINEMSLNELFEAQKKLANAIEERVQMLGEKIAKKLSDDEMEHEINDLLKIAKKLSDDELEHEINELLKKCGLSGKIKKGLKK